MGPVCIAWVLNQRINIHLIVLKRAAFKSVLLTAKNIFTYLNGQFTPKQNQTLGPVYPSPFFHCCRNVCRHLNRM